MATVGALTYLGSDAYGGAVGLLSATPVTSRVPLRVDGPRGNTLGTLAAALPLACYWVRNPDAHVLRVNRELRPDLVAVAESLIAAGAFQRAASGETFAAAADDLLATCDQDH